jgi:polysaccharide biosynthesis protein PslH
MKILFLAHRTPYPPDKGDKVRSFNLLSHLAKRHELSLVYWVDDSRDLDHASYLRSLCKGLVIPVRLKRGLAMARALWALLTGRSFTEGYYGSVSFQHAVERTLSNGVFDAVFVFSSAVASYAKNIDSKIKIIDFVDVDSDKWGQLAKVSPFPLSMLYRLEQKRLLDFDVEISRWASSSLFVSAAEAALFRQQGGKGAIEFLANGTDLELRRLPVGQMPFHTAGREGVRQPDGPRLIFVGTMDYYPNIDAVQYFAKEIFPLIRQQFPRAIFQIVGRSPTKAVRRLNHIDGVQVLGEVSEVRSYLLQADVSVAPMRIARGVQNKVLEAMAMGIPVVASPAAIQGIEVTDGEDVLTGASPEEFALKVTMLLTDAELRKAITKRAWNTMKQLYNWELIGTKLEALLNAAPSHEAPRQNEHGISAAQR